MEIISADSVQVYRGLDIGSAKPGSDELRRIPHHNIDVCEPSRDYTVANFVRIAEAAIDEVSRRGGLPVVSGGTAFYLKHLWFGLPESPPKNSEVAAVLEAELAERGPQTLRDELERVDPVSAGRIAPADHYRLLRALEVFRSSGRPLSSYRVPDAPKDNFSVLPLALHRPRQQLYARIDQRVEHMFDLGLEREVAGLMAAGCRAEDPGMKAIGYREFFVPRVAEQLTAHGRLEESQRQQLIEQISQASRRYAKRQITFFKSLPGLRWIDGDDIDELSNEIARFMPECMP